MSNRFSRNARLLFSTRIRTYVSSFFPISIFHFHSRFRLFPAGFCCTFGGHVCNFFGPWLVPGGRAGVFECIYFIRAHFRPSGLWKFIPAKFLSLRNSDCSTRYNRNSSTTGFSAAAIHRVSLYPAPFLFAFFHSFVPGGSFFFIYFHFMSDCEKVDWVFFAVVRNHRWKGIRTANTRYSTPLTNTTP